MDKAKFKKMNGLLHIVCQYMKLHHEILFSFQCYISRLTVAKVLEITASLFFPLSSQAQSTKHFESRSSCFLIIQATVISERILENWWSNYFFFLTSSSLTPMSDIKDRQRDIFMAVIVFSSITDRDITVKCLEYFCQEVPVKKKKKSSK